MREAYLRALWIQDEIQDWWWGKWKVSHRIQLGNPSQVGVKVQPIVTVFKKKQSDILVMKDKDRRIIVDTGEKDNAILTREYRWVPSIADLWEMDSSGILRGKELAILIELLGFDGSKHGRLWYKNPS